MKTLKKIWKNHKKHQTMHLVTKSMIQFDKPFCNGGRGIVRETRYVKHMVYMVINKAVLKNWVYL